MCVISSKTIINSFILDSSQWHITDICMTMKKTIARPIASTNCILLWWKLASRVNIICLIHQLQRLTCVLGGRRSRRFVKKIGYTPKIVLRVTFPSITCVVEYAKKYSEGEYYKDKVKIVLCSIIYFRNLLKKTNNCDIEISDDNFQTRRGNVNKSWFVLEKVADSGYTPKCRTCKGRGNQKLCQ